MHVVVRQGHRTAVFRGFDATLAGCWLVVNGGIDEETSHSWELVGQRYAYDFVIDQEGRTYQGEGTRLEDYYAFGQPILAPADGRVVQVREGIRDYPRPLPLSGRIDWLTRDFRGNFVVIDHGHQEYSFLAHLQRGSVRVRVGDKVSQGQIIGLCGNSGHSTEPHLHFHVQDHPNMFLAVSLPVRFAGFRLSDDPETASRPEAYLSRGQRIVMPPTDQEPALQT
ncbi:MAG: M23 family metallopeptidase [Truepera sp.]|nr:M23 family metallopeptidase [Truepera sp.]